MAYVQQLMAEILEGGEMDSCIIPRAGKSLRKHLNLTER